MVIVDIFGFILGVAIIFFVARPLAQAFSDRLRKQSKRLEAGDRDALQERINCLETEVTELKRQMTQVQESTEFMNKYIEAAKESARIEQSKELK